jgi:1-acyl-sn-glycerol-3-phosphate acyltransferase
MRVWYEGLVYEASRSLCTLLSLLCFRINVIGARKVPRNGAVIVASNHASLLDPMLMGCVVPRRLTFLAKEELILFRAPISRWWMKTVGCKKVRRGTGDLAPFRITSRALKEGGAIIIFPEGTRTRTGNMQRGKPGLGKMLAMTQATVVPVWVGGTYKLFPPGKKLPRLGKARVVFGDPIPWQELADEADNKEGYQEITDRVMKEIFALSEKYALKSTLPYQEQSRKNLLIE